MSKDTYNNTTLGKKTEYINTYDASLLFPISRAPNREALNIETNALPFSGYDCWNHYEFSWLNLKGKPIAAMLTIIYDCRSPNIVESKSLKLYFNSFNNTQFESSEQVHDTIKQDINKAIGYDVTIQIHLLNDTINLAISASLTGSNIDELDITCDTYMVDPSLLTTADEIVTETLTSNLLKSNCPVTNQPDWGSVQITYKGPQINRVNLLKYIVSFRNHNEFHEQCIERIFTDIMSHCKPNELTVYGRYTRRGGLDINPYRSTQPDHKHLNTRLIRQ